MKHSLNCALVRSISITMLVVLSSSLWGGTITVTDVGKSFGYDNASINNALAACQASADKTLYFSGGNYNVSSSMTLSGVNVVMGQGTMVSINDGVTLTINGSFSAGLYQVFGYNGANSRVYFDRRAVREVHPEWWGVGFGDDSIPINRAIQSLWPGDTYMNGQVKLAGGYYQCVTPINIDHDRVTLVGAGMHTSNLFFAPNAPNQTLIVVRKSGVVSQVILRDFGIQSGNTQTGKTAIELDDVDTVEVRNIVMYGATAGVDFGVGIRIKGRQVGCLEDLTLAADQPLKIEQNYHRPTQDTIDIDHFAFRNIFCITLNANNAGITIDSGVNLSNVTFDGTNPIVHGKYGIYWADTTSAQIGNSLSIKNFRFEQASVPGGYMVYIAHNYKLQSLILENLYDGSPANGIYLRKIQNGTIQNCVHSSGSGVALDIDNSSGNLVFCNNMWNAGSQILTGNLIKVFGTSRDSTRYDNSSPGIIAVRAFEVFDSPNNEQGEGIMIYGTKTWCNSSYLNNGGATLALPISRDESSVGSILITAANGSTKAGGQYIFSGDGTMTQVAGTSNMSLTDTAGRLCLITVANRAVLKNNLPTGVNLVITVFWNSTKPHY